MYLKSLIFNLAKIILVFCNTEALSKDTFRLKFYLALSLLPYEKNNCKIVHMTICLQKISFLVVTVSHFSWHVSFYKFVQTFVLTLTKPNSKIRAETQSRQQVCELTIYVTVAFKRRLQEIMKTLFLYNALQWPSF